MRRRARIWKYDEEHTLDVCRSTFNELSNVTPRSLILSERFICEPETLMEVRLLSDFLRPAVPIQMASVLSGLRARPFWRNHARREIRHEFIWSRLAPSVFGVIEMNS